MTMPEPVSPPVAVRTSIDTTLGRILAATDAIEPGGRRTGESDDDDVLPMVTACGAGATAVSWRDSTIRPLTAPPVTAARPVVMASTAHPGGAPSPRSIPPLCPVTRLASDSGGDHRHRRRHH